MRRIRWTRTIVFDGPEDIVLDVMAHSWIHELGKINPREHPRPKLDVECTEYKVETYDTQENTSEIGKG